MEESLTIYCDGGSRGNPGHAASAFVVMKGSEVIHSEGRYIGIETNNVAEYQAVLMATEWLVQQLTINNSEFTNKTLTVFNLDSQLVERQLNGFYKIKNTKLKELHDEIKFRISKFGFRISFQWSYRDKNKLADDLVNRTLDEKISLASTGKQNSLKV